MRVLLLCCENGQSTDPSQLLEVSGFPFLPTSILFAFLPPTISALSYLLFSTSSLGRLDVLGAGDRVLTLLTA